MFPRVNFCMHARAYDNVSNLRNLPEVIAQSARRRGALWRSCAPEKNLCEEALCDQQAWFREHVCSNFTIPKQRKHSSKLLPLLKQASFRHVVNGNVCSHAWVNSQQANQ